MYSPKIKEEFIPILFKISASKRIPMTKLVNRIIKDYLEKNSPAETDGKPTEQTCFFEFKDNL